MNKIRRIVRDIITELFDNIQNIDYIQEKKGDDYFCKFKIEDIDYVVVFRLFKDVSKLFVKDEKIRNIIENTKNKYYTDWGTNINGIVDTKVETNLFNVSKVINATTFIKLDFIKNNNVDIIAYFAESRRKRIYKEIFDKYFATDFVFYAKKIESDVIPVFYINKKLFKDETYV